MVLGVLLPGKSQCDLKLKENINNKCKKEGFTNLKEFNFEINKPADTVKYNILLEKDKLYRFYFGISDKYISDVELSIFWKKNKEKALILNKGISQIDWTPNYTGVFEFNSKMIRGNKSCGIILITVDNSSNAHKTNLLPDKNSNNSVKSDSTVHFMVDEMPVFIIGKDAMAFREWVGQNIKYSEIDFKKDVQGKVYVQFVVDAEGNVKDVHIIRGLYPKIDTYIANIFKASPKWQKPGKLKNKAVSVQLVIWVNI